jgi:hypothetical protein
VTHPQKSTETRVSEREYRVDLVVGFLLRDFDQALGLLVPVSSMHCCTSTPGLSTLWSSRGLTPFEGWEILS